MADNSWARFKTESCWSDVPLPPPIDSPHFNSPCLMFSQRSSSSWKFFHSLYNDFYYMDFPELVDAEIRFSKDGWLLMSRDKGPLFFFNPLTKAKFELPPTIDPFLSVCFTSRPTSSDCFIFGLFLNDLEFGLIKFGDNEWKTELMNNNNYKFWQTDCPPLFHNGIYYWLEYRKRNIRIFDPKENESRWINFGKCEKEGEEDEEEEDGNNEDEEEDEEEDEDEGYDEEEEEEKDDNEDEEDDDDEEEVEEIERSYMLEVEGDIWAVFVGNEGKRVSVEKLDLSEMRWRKLDSLGDKCIYLSTFGSFAETCVDDRELASKIYFDKFYDKNGVIYCLTSGMYYSVAGNFAAKEVSGLSQVFSGAWIKPTLLEHS